MRAKAMNRSTGRALLPSAITCLHPEIIDRRDLINQRYAEIRLARAELAFEEEQAAAALRIKNDEITQFREAAKARRLLRAARRGNWMDTEKSMTSGDEAEGDICALMANPPAMIEPYMPSLIDQAFQKSVEAGGKAAR